MFFIAVRIENMSSAGSHSSRLQSTSSRLMEVLAQKLWLRVAERGERYRCFFFVQYHTLHIEQGCYRHCCYLLAVIYVSIVFRSHAVQDRRSLSQGKLKMLHLQEVLHRYDCHSSSRLMEVLSQPLWLRLAVRVEQYLRPFVQ